jgi:hypothetical protein
VGGSSSSSGIDSPAGAQQRSPQPLPCPTTPRHHQQQINPATTAVQAALGSNTKARIAGPRTHGTRSGAPI